MNVIYKKGPCSHKQCCPEGDSHDRVVELKGGVRFVRGGDAVEMGRVAGEKLLADHPGMFAEEAKPKVAKSLPSLKK